MRIILVPIGSAGDVHPYIGIGCELKRRGHEVQVMTSEYFRELVEKAGLEFTASSTLEDFNRLVVDPLLWDPWRGFEFIARNAFLPFVPKLYEFLEQAHIPGQTLVVGSSFAWGARIAQEKLNLPLVTLHLQPAAFPSLYETPVYSPAAWLAGMPVPLKRAHFQLIDILTDAVVAPEINRVRASLGLQPVPRVIREWTHSPLRTIGLFPEWFSPRQRDWPAGVHLTGFPLYDVDHIQTMPEEVEAFLDQGPAPVVFTSGSAMKQARSMFEVSAEACRRLGCRGLLINKFEDQIPASLPPGVMAARYAPFSRLFPRAAAVVHHGGIGTTAQALAAGVPQLVTPFAHDQFDNAARVVRLGAGEQLHTSRYRVKPLAAALERLMKDAALRERAQAMRLRFDGPAALSQTCDLILEAAIV